MLQATAYTWAESIMRSEELCGAAWREPSFPAELTVVMLRIIARPGRLRRLAWWRDAAVGQRDQMSLCSPLSPWTRVA
jgi:hypothetical protein